MLSMTSLLKFLRHILGQHLTLRDSFDDVTGYHTIRCTKDIYFKYNYEKHLFF